MSGGPERSIVDVRNFVLATRDSGYRSTAAAVAELIDNAVQAKAQHIHVWVRERKGVSAQEIHISVLDDGKGMDPITLRKALQFGGSDRFNERSGMGRFGMGLPNSSLSQSRRVEVYSWQKQGEIYRTYLDVDEIAVGEIVDVPVPMPTTLPPSIDEVADASGTLVNWPRCDRLENRRPQTIARKLHAPLGRRFRNFLWRGVEISVNDVPVQPIDPLFLHPNALYPGATECFEPIEYSFQQANCSQHLSKIRVRFSILPIELWHDWPADQKRRSGISSGAGISIMRADREISYGWHFMGKRRRQNYDDWWRCEVSFEPELDEWFGVTHSKQDINPTPELQEILTPDLVAIANRLNNEVRQRFASFKTSAASAAVNRGATVEWVLPTVNVASTHRGQVTEEYERTGRLRYEIGIEPRTGPDFLSWRMENGALKLILNKNHPFFERVYQPLREHGDSESLFHIECLLLAYARSEARNSVESGQASVAQLRQEWSNTLAAMLS